MTAWVKVYNSMPAHPKVLMAGERAAWLAVCGLCYANEHLTNGFIARHVLPIVAPGVKGAESLARKLVTAGLWDVIEGGWQIHDYDEHQRSAEEIRVTRSWDAERKSLFRDRELVAAIRARDGDRCRYCGRKVNWLDRRGECGGTYDHVIPRGGNTFENVVIACKRCNSRKGARTPEQASMPLRYLDPDLDPDLDREPDPIKTEVEVEVDREVENKNNNAELRSAVVECFVYWQEKCGHKQARLTGDRKAKIVARLKEGYTVADVHQGIDGAARAAFVDEKGKRFDDIELICRKGSKLEDFMARATLPPGNVVPMGQRRESASDWIKAINGELT